MMEVALSLEVRASERTSALMMSPWPSRQITSPDEAASEACRAHTASEEYHMPTVTCVEMTSSWGPCLRCAMRNVIQKSAWLRFFGCTYIINHKKHTERGGRSES